MIRILTLLFILIAHFNVFSQTKETFFELNSNVENLLNYNNVIELGYGNLNTFIVSHDNKYLVSAGGSGSLYLWDINTKKVIKTFKGYFDIISSLAINSEGTIIASGSVNGIIKLWDVETVSLIRTIYAHDFVIKSLDYSPDGKYILSGSEDSKAKLWNVKTGELFKTLDFVDEVEAVTFNPDGNSIAIANMNCPVLFEIHIIKDIFKDNSKKIKINTSGVYGLKFSPDSKYIFGVGSTGTNRNSPIGIWDAETGILIDTLKGDSYNDESISFSPDGSKFATCGNNGNGGSVDIWEINSRNLLKSITTFKFAVMNVSFVSNNTLCISDGNNMILYDINNDTIIDSLKGHTGKLNSVSFSPDNKKLIAGYSDGLIKHWNLENKENLHDFIGHTHNVTELSYFPDGQRIMSAGDEAYIRIWDVNNGEILKEIKVFPTDAQLSPDGNYIAFGHRSGATGIIEVASGNTYNAVWVGQGSVKKVTYSPNGKYIASFNDKVMIWDVESFTIIDSISIENYLYNITFTPDNENLLMAQTDKIMIWNLKLKSVIDSFPIANAFMNDMVFSSDNSKLICTSLNNLQIIDFNSKSLQKIINLPCVSVAFSKDNKLFATAEYYGACRVWNTDELLSVDDDLPYFYPEESINIFPNPCHGFINVSINSYKNLYPFLMNLYNSSGELIRTFQINSSNQSIDISKLPSGIYYTSLYSDGNVISQKIILYK